MNLILKIISLFPVKIWQKDFSQRIIDIEKDITMPVGTGLYARFIYKLKTAKLQREIKRNLKLDKEFSIVKYWQQQQIPPVQSLNWQSYVPKIDVIIRERFVPELNKLADELKASPANPKPINIAFGDSLTDFLRGYSAVIDDRANCGIAGTYSELIQYVMQMISLILPKLGLIPVNIRMGCFVGNALLGYEAWEPAEKAMKSCLEVARRLFPESKFLIYGLPPIFDIYAVSHQDLVRKDLVEFVKSDKNSVYLDLQASFGKGLFSSPQCEFSFEGVHETPEAKRIDDLLMKTGISAPAGSTIFWNQKQNRTEILY